MPLQCKNTAIDYEGCSCIFYNQQKHFNFAAKAQETIELRATLTVAREREVEHQAAQRIEQVGLVGSHELYLICCVQARIL